MKKYYMKIIKLFLKKYFFKEGYLFLNPDVAATDIDPLEHYIIYGIHEGRTLGWPSPYEFNADNYLSMNEDVRASGMDPWKHYVLYGYQEGRSNGIIHSNAARKVHVVPVDFNEELYIECNNDIKNLYIDPATYHLHAGANEGRIGYNIKSCISVYGDIHNFDKKKKTCAIVTHDLSQTGCPINTWNMMHILKNRYNIVAISLGDGPLKECFQKEADLFIVCNQKIRYSERAINICLRSVIGDVDIDFAIVNSIESRYSLYYFAIRRIPALHFIHEFAYMYTKEAFLYSFINAGVVVFSSNIVRDAAFEKASLKIECPVIPQGKSELMWDKSLIEESEKVKLASISRRKEENKEIIFLGVGTVDYRKGVDLFIRVASEIKKRCPERKFRFLWAGNGFDVRKKNFSGMLDFQITQYGLQDELEFIGTIKDIDAVYSLSDVLLLTSILDPLPGVVIEAMSHKCPALVFEGCSGFPELFDKYDVHCCVANYLDVIDMSEKTIRIINNDNIFNDVKEKQYKLFKSVFNMKDYIDNIIKLVPDVRDKINSEYKKFYDSIPENEIGNAPFIDFLRHERAKKCNPSILSPVILGLEKQVFPDKGVSYEYLMEKVGGNTGNLAFHYALDRILGGNIPVISWADSFNLNTFEVGIIPCANQLGTHCDMGGFAKKLNEADIPVVAIGLGAQSKEKNNSRYMIPEIPEGTKDWVKSIVDHAPSNFPNISLRGEFSFRVMENLGLADHAVVLGCPSLYINPDPDLGKKIASHMREPRRVALAAGHENWKDIDRLENSLSEIITETDGAFVAAHGINMLKAARGEIDTLSAEDFKRVHEHFYKKLSDEDFREWITKRGHVFFNVPDWMSFYRQFDFVVGPRIHGIMLALQAEVPALCIAIDSRTQELCETMNIPYVTASDVSSGISRHDLVKLFKFDPDIFDKRRRMLAQQFFVFLKNNKLDTKNYLSGILKNYYI